MHRVSPWGPLENLAKLAKWSNPKTPFSTKGPMWGYPRPVLGAVDPFLEPFRGRLSPNIDNVSKKLTLRYPHEGPWVAAALLVEPSRLMT